jgi:hypothetical protein
LGTVRVDFMDVVIGAVHLGDFWALLYVYVGVWTLLNVVLDVLGLCLVLAFLRLLGRESLGNRG